MRIMWWSNAPWASSGYGVQTRLVAPRLKAMGHEVAIMTNCGLEGAQLTWEGIPVYPRGFLPLDKQCIAHQIEQFKPDVVISFYDAWALSKDIFGERWAPWFPVDRDPFPAAVEEKVRDAFGRIVCSRYGVDKAEDAGLDVEYVPCCVDTSAYCPMDQAEAREALGIPHDVFVVGIVADNKGWPSRKALPQQIEAFARLHEQHDDARLFLHTCMTPARGGVDLVGLVKHLGIEKALIVSDQGQYQQGFPQDYMRAVYNAIDVLSAVTMDEGFGVPIVEAQACGTPVIAGDWHSMSELVGPGSWLVDRSDAEPWWDQTGGYRFLPHVSAIHYWYEHMYSICGSLDGFTDALRAKAMDYDADTVAQEYWAPVLGRLAERINTADKGDAAADAAA